MSLTLSTPALLFSTISLLLLAYTNRFLALSALIRNLHGKYKTNPEQIILKQIKLLKRRVLLIRNMQLLGIVSLILCVVTMFLIYEETTKFLASYLFGASLILLTVSLSLSLVEIFISVKALNIQLEDIESGKSM